eukprot:6195903-Pleurochrysis_carterae.AAC.1
MPQSTSATCNGCGSPREKGEGSLHSTNVEIQHIAFISLAPHKVRWPPCWLSKVSASARQCVLNPEQSSVIQEAAYLRWHEHAWLESSLLVLQHSAGVPALAWCER